MRGEAVSDRHRLDEPECEVCGYDRDCPSCGGEGYRGIEECPACEGTGSCQSCTPNRQPAPGYPIGDKLRP